MYRVICFFIFFFIVFVPVHTVSANNSFSVNVFVSILPQKYLIERIGGDRVRVSVMVKPGHSPETYEPTPKQMSALHEAHLYFRMAVPFESVWINRIRDLNPDIRIVECCGEIQIRDPARHDHEESRASYAIDAHVWTSPKNAIVIAGIIKLALSEFDPESAGYYAENYENLVRDLVMLDVEIRRELADIKIPYFIVSHPSWGHYAETYGLEQISIEQHGTEVRAKELSRLVEFARQWNINTVFVQKQFNTASAKTLAREINAKIIELDPLAEDYINNLRAVTKAIASAARLE